MIQINETEEKHLCLDILLFFDKMCKENGLKYSIAYGTLIGAVRHGGFIPWDNDIDVIMPREDYDKLLSVAANDKYEILDFKTAKDYYYPFVKIIRKDTKLIEKNRIEKQIGVFIDVFPIDYFQKSDKKELVTEFKKIIDKINFYTCDSDSGFKNFIKRFYMRTISIFNPNFLKKLLYDYENMIKKDSYNRKSFSLCGNMSDCDCYDRDLFDYDLFENDLILLKFEGHNVSSIDKYDYYLKQIYGDYMKPPKKEDRVAPHNFKAWYINEQEKY